MKLIGKLLLTGVAIFMILLGGLCVLGGVFEHFNLI